MYISFPQPVQATLCTCCECITLLEVQYVHVIMPILMFFITKVHTLHSYGRDKTISISEPDTKPLIDHILLDKQFTYKVQN